MSLNDEHYQKLVENKGKSKCASCGYSDRFDPFVLNKVPRIRGLYHDLFESFLSDIPCSRLLDVGCGTGIYFDVLSKYADHIEAIDCSEDMIRIAQQYCDENELRGINPQTGSVESLQHEDESFDVVIELDVLHHVTDFDATLNEIWRVLKPGGHFLVFEPNICNPLMFLAHALPREERLALQRNQPRKLLSSLETRFNTVRWRGICSLITQTSGPKRLILDTYLKLCSVFLWERCYPRQGWLGVKT
ncbi:class I SAM-dependent methyltransferase [Candidatus Hydrogenedentota bacterium]